MILNAYEAALARAEAMTWQGCPVPPMTHPLGKHWDQPDPRKWTFTETEVMMPKADFDKLLDYSRSQPSGVYEGKMWKSSRGHSRSDPWHLHFWVASEKPECCKGGVRTIVIV